MIGGAAAGVFSDAIWRDQPVPVVVLLLLLLLLPLLLLMWNYPSSSANGLNHFAISWSEKLRQLCVLRTVNVEKKWRFWHWILCKPNAVTLYQAAENLPNLPLISRYLTRAKTIAGIWKGWVGLERGMEYIFLSQYFTAEKKEKIPFFSYTMMSPQIANGKVATCNFFLITFNSVWDLLSVISLLILVTTCIVGNC